MMLKKLYRVEEICTTMNIRSAIQDDIISDHVKTAFDDLLKMRDDVVVNKISDGRYMGSYMNDTRFYIVE